MKGIAMTHTRVLSRILLALTFLTGAALRADAIDDAITTHTNSYTAECCQ